MKINYEDSGLMVWEMDVNRSKLVLKFFYKSILYDDFLGILEYLIGAECKIPITLFLKYCSSSLPFPFFKKKCWLFQSFEKSNDVSTLYHYVGDILL